MSIVFFYVGLLLLLLMSEYCPEISRNFGTFNARRMGLKWYQSQGKCFFQAFVWLSMNLGLGFIEIVFIPRDAYRHGSKKILEYYLVPRICCLLEAKLSSIT